MDEAFEKLKKEGKNDVDNLVKWMKDSKLIDSSEEAEAKARTLFKDCEDITNIQLEKFKELLEKMAEEQKKTIEELIKILADQRPKILDALTAGVKAFKEVIEK